ncbi:hypothetical protein PMZ80_007856 [Knufia obscura]|uniref:STAS domain-containing protein n=2 Tax=Knufia TaxID=430999 RepID=A0AAN8F186_9EURO|nr:hypothetical protein PMZ80_007856 [Knufia obscura]KAK5949496.1 hypothetical protein OHC33_009489 [Knufia fluminis]
MNYLSNAVSDTRNDYTWNSAIRLTAKGARALPTASAHYAVDKLPIIGWLPRYNYRWLINDVIAGLTVGLMLIPQGLSYAKIAKIPVEYGLMSSWFPPGLYAFMGTTKDLSTGPTSLIGLLTSHAVDALSGDYTPSEIASAMACLMGVYGMAIGFLKLGFLLEYVSLPILSGFISAVAITIILNQMDSLLGENDVRDGTAHSIHDIFSKLPEANGYACAVGFTGILFLTILEHAGKRWSEKYKVVWLLSITRAFLCLVLFTGVSYAVNKPLGPDKDNFLFEVAAVKANGIEHPRFPKTDLIGKVASRSIALFIGAAVEHTGIARAFGVRNNYETDQSQELAYFGVANFFNSFFHSMGVGGAMSRTAVNSACKVKSPLSGFVTMAVVLISIYELVGTLYWIPKATLAAIIICAVWPLISAPSTFYSYWKTSLADFISAMLALWVSLFVSNEIGLAVAVGFNIVYCMMRQTFARVKTVSSENQSELEKLIDESRGVPQNTPADVRIFRFNDSFFFANSFANKTAILDVIRTHHAPAYSSVNGAEAERNWSVVAEKHLARLRKKAHIHDISALPPIRLLILDFVKVNHFDYTALRHLRDLMNELKKYAGKDVEVRFVGLTPYVRMRFERGGFPVCDAGLPGDGENKDAVRVYSSVASAVHGPRKHSAVPIEVVMAKADTDSVEEVSYAHQEKS